MDATSQDGDNQTDIQPVTNIVPLRDITVSRSANGISDRFEAANYNALLLALDRCHTVDEVKACHDKSAAIAEYARQAHDEEALRRFREIQLRAKRRLGQLLSATEKAKGGGDQRSDHRSRPATGGPKTLSEHGISKSLSSEAQRLAAIPDPVFEQVMAEPKPSTTKIIERNKVVVQPRKRRSRRLKERATLFADFVQGWYHDLRYEDPEELLDALPEDTQSWVSMLAHRGAAWLARTPRIAVQLCAVTAEADHGDAHVTNGPSAGDTP
jgi:hypothetical protein